MPETLNVLRITLATGNLHKVTEITTMAERYLDTEKHPSLALHFEASPHLGDPEENGATFIDNALIKAKAATPAIGSHWVLAEDSGLGVAALENHPQNHLRLNPFPGVHSNRWLTPPLKRQLLGIENPDPATTAEKNQALLTLLQGESNRLAHYHCAMVLYHPHTGQTLIAEGQLPLHVIPSHETPRGENGFGYDPIMMAYGDETHRTIAELSKEEKNAISHRAQAFKLLLSTLNRLDWDGLRSAE